VGSLIGRLTKPALGARGLAGADICAHWPEIVGPELSALAVPIGLKRERGNMGVLQMRVASSAAATLLQLKGPQIVDRVNRYFGYAAVARLQVAPGPMPRPPVAAADPPPLSAEAAGEIEQMLAPVPPGELRTALARLGAAVRRRSLPREP
jgi:hypothetical protein